MTVWGVPVEPAWLWIIGGLVVAACELLAPGAFLIWIGLAAILTGIVVAVAALPWEIQVLVFALLALVCVVIGRRTTRSSASGLNNRGHSLVGREFTLDGPIVGGVGLLRLGDTSWRLTGPDLPAGTRIRVAALDGATLQVVPDPGQA